MKIGVVIVTHNRLEKLKKCLTSYDAQSYSPEFIVVINNASTDGTREYLDSWKQETATVKRVVVHSSSNLGGSGGFCAGISDALKMESDWIWLADDDAYPEPTCLEELVYFHNDLKICEREKIVALCGRVNDKNGLSPLHRRRLYKRTMHIKEIPIKLCEYENRSFDLDIFSFVGTMIKTEVVKRIGLPRDDYFICYDDSEYALRIGKEGIITCVTNALIFHDSLENTLQRRSWKNYYMFRNKLYTYKTHFARRYFYAECFKTFYMMIAHFNSKLSWLQWLHAMRDCHKEILGKSKKYLP